MNAQNLTSSPKCKRFATIAHGGCRPFAAFSRVAEFVGKLRGDLPLARRLVGRLRGEAKGDGRLLRWLRIIEQSFEQACRREREAVARRPRWQDVPEIEDFEEVPMEDYERYLSRCLGGAA